MIKKLKVLDLFSGIGGFSLGLERAGMSTVAFCEIEPHAQKILKKHWPDIPIFEDITNLKYNGEVDVITGGFPCQDLSIAGKKGGLQAPRSGLWKHMCKAISDYRPSFAIIENVSNLLTGESGAWFTKLLYDLSTIGYDAQWHIIPASAVGKGHHRKRVWIIAYPHQKRWDVPQKIYNNIAFQISKIRTPGSTLSLLSDFKQIQLKGSYPDHRKLDGLSDAVDRIERLGNAIVPDIAQIIGQAIIQSIISEKET